MVALISLLLGGYYAVYVTLLRMAIQVAVVASLLVSADRVLNVLKYVLIAARAKITGRHPNTRWNYQPLPDDPHQYPKVSFPTAAAPALFCCFTLLFSLKPS